MGLGKQRGVDGSGLLPCILAADRVVARPWHRFGIFVRVF